MKDPLRNNKIKSTKKQKIKVANQGPQKQSKIPVVGVVILVLVLVWIGYRIYQQNLNPQNQESNQPTQESQQQTINKTNSDDKATAKNNK
jgi:cytoskeletal protein RodZ